MLSLFPIHLILLALILSISTGCAQFNTQGEKGISQSPYRPPLPNVQSDVDDLLSFGAKMANMTVPSRAEQCRSLLKRQNEPAGGGMQLYLMVGRLLSDACGDIPKILEGVASIPAGNFSDERMQMLVSIHTETLKRMNNTSKKLGVLERKQKSVQSALESKESTGSKKDESRLLREKLEAIRSMEKQLDESGDGN